MKRTKPAPNTRKPSTDDLLKKLREVDDETLKTVYGGDACNSRCCRDNDGGCGYY